MPRDALLDPAAPLQRRVLALLDDVLEGVDAVAVDGCGAPAVPTSLSGLARGFHRLLTEERFARVRRAGIAHGGLVGGRGRLDSALLDASVLAKAGAEGVYGAAWRDADGRPWSVAVKCEDGAERAASVALDALTRDLGLLPAGTWSPPPVLGGGHPVGQVRPATAVRELAAAVGASSA